MAHAGGLALDELMDNLSFPRELGRLCASRATGWLIVDATQGRWAILLHDGRPCGLASGEDAAPVMRPRSFMPLELSELVSSRPGPFHFQATLAESSTELQPVDPYLLLVAHFGREAEEWMDGLGQRLSTREIKSVGNPRLLSSLALDELGRRLFEAGQRSVLGSEFLALAGVDARRSAPALASLVCLGLLQVASSAARVGSGPTGGAAPADGAAEHSARRSRLLRRAFKNIPGAGVMTNQAVGTSSSDTPESESSSSSQAVKETSVAAPSGIQSSPASPSLAGLEELLKLEQDLKRQNHYERLGVERLASAAEIRAAYVALVKRYHPDRAGPLGLTRDSAQLLRRVFQSIQEAHEALRNGRKKAEYDALLDGRPAETEESKEDRSARAKREFQKGEELFKRKDYRGALDHLTRATEVDPSNGRWQALEAWTMFCLGPKEEVRDDVKRRLARAASKRDAKGVASYYLGIIARMDGDLEKAVSFFRTAVEQEPGLLEAAAELREAKRKMSSSSSPAMKSLIKKLFG